MPLPKGINKKAALRIVNHFLENKPSSFIHGTNSSALPGIKRAKGLRPSGKFIASKSEFGVMTELAPFSGELGVGLGFRGMEGISEAKVSASPLSHARDAIKYAESKSSFLQEAMGTKGWTPEGSIKKVQVIRNIRDAKLEVDRNFSSSDSLKRIKRVEELLIKKQGQFSPEHKNSRYVDLESLDRQENIELNRMIHWSKLGESDRSLVREGFPVLIQPHKAPDEVVHPAGGMKEGLFSEIKLDESSLFVPGNHVEKVKKVVGHDRVFSLETFEKLADELKFADENKLLALKKELE